MTTFFITTITELRSSFTLLRQFL